MKHHHLSPDARPTRYRRSPYDDELEPTEHTCLDDLIRDGGCLAECLRHLLLHADGAELADPHAHGWH